MVKSELVRSLNVLVPFKGFRFSFVIVPRELDVLPIITSSIRKFKSFVGSRNNLLNPVTAPVPLTVAVAPEVCPVRVSPTVNANVCPLIIEK